MPTYDDQNDQGMTEEQVDAPRRRMRFSTIVVVLVILLAVAWIVYSEIQRRKTAEALNVTSQRLEQLQKNPRAFGEEVTKTVLEKARKHMIIPDAPAPTVLTVLDAALLKKENDFYKRAENGDHVIVTEERAILYDPDSDIILDVVPVIRPSASPAPVATQPASPQASPIAGTP